MASAQAILKSTFGYDEFRPGQEEIVGAIVAGEDVLAVMPTGARQVAVLPAAGARAMAADRRRLAADRADARPGQQMAHVGVAAAR